MAHTFAFNLAYKPCHLFPRKILEQCSIFCMFQLQDRQDTFLNWTVVTYLYSLQVLNFWLIEPWSGFSHGRLMYIFWSNQCLCWHLLYFLCSKMTGTVRAWGENMMCFCNIIWVVSVQRRSLFPSICRGDTFVRNRLTLSTNVKKVRFFYFSTSRQMRNNAYEGKLLQLEQCSGDKILERSKLGTVTEVQLNLTEAIKFQNHTNQFQLELLEVSINSQWNNKKKLKI